MGKREEFIMDGEKYYLLANGMWTDSKYTVVSKPEQLKLDKIRLESMKLEEMSYSELVDLAQEFKDNDNPVYAKRLFDRILEECNDIKIIKSVVPRYSSILRKQGKYDEAIEFVDEYLGIYGKSIESAALFTSLGGAYCDKGDYQEARKKANKAKALSGGNSSQELINLYSRIKGMEK